MLAIASNNLTVLLIYICAGILVMGCTKSKLAPYVPWVIFLIHLVQISILFGSAAASMGWLPCLALVLPHGWLEISGLVMGCRAGSKLCLGAKPYKLILISTIAIILGAYIESHITPFPFYAWLLK